MCFCLNGLVKSLVICHCLDHILFIDLCTQRTTFIVQMNCLALLTENIYLVAAQPTRLARAAAAVNYSSRVRARHAPHTGLYFDPLEI